MKRLGLVAVLVLIAGAAHASEMVFLLASTGEIIVECRDKDGVYLSFQLDGLPACYSFECTRIEARLDGGS